MPSPLAARLASHVFAAQVRSHPNARMIGLWPSDILVGGRVYPDVNIFAALTIANVVADISEHLEPSSVAASSAAFHGQLDLFIADARATGEPDGTIAFWPLWQRGGRRFRSPDPAFDHINEPNDLDDSSQAAIWLMRRFGIRHPFVAAFFNILGTFRDLDRTEPGGSEKRWKRLKSGAFLTWVAARDHANAKRARNDVDCVVNLNILQAVGRYLALGGVLGSDAATGAAAACELTARVLADDLTGVCGCYYDRPSQMLAGFARAHATGLPGLAALTTLANARIESATAAALAAAETNTTELAELAIAAKLLNPPPRAQAEPLIARLTARMRAGFAEDGDLVRVATKDSIFVDDIGSAAQWISPPVSMALALYALLLP